MPPSFFNRARSKYVAPKAEVTGSTPVGCANDFNGLNRIATGQILQHRLVEPQASHQLLELAILIFELLQPSHLIRQISTTKCPSPLLQNKRLLGVRKLQLKTIWFSGGRVL
jgi:hypothetical protein